MLLSLCLFIYFLLGFGDLDSLHFVTSNNNIFFLTHNFGGFDSLSLFPAKLERRQLFKTQRTQIGGTLWWDGTPTVTTKAKCCRFQDWTILRSRIVGPSKKQKKTPCLSLVISCPWSIEAPIGQRGPWASVVSQWDKGEFVPISQ